MADPRNPKPGPPPPDDETGPPVPPEDENWDEAAEEWSEAGTTVEPSGEEVGAVPLEESGFSDTPITVAGGGLGPLPEDDDEGLVTLEVGDALLESGVPTLMESAPDTAPTVVGETPPGQAALLFSSEPPPDPEVASLSEPLAEMAPEIWLSGVRALVTVPDAAEPSWPPRTYWSDLGRLYLDELGVADTAARQVEMTLAAARVAELAADAQSALALYDDALTLTPDQPEVLRSRARLAEATGDLDVAQAAWTRLAQVAPTEDERAFYAALAAEWQLGRSGGLDAAGLEALPEGVARALAAAEAALLGGTPGEVAVALEEAAFAAGGAVGGALLDAAARFHEVAGDPATAAERRFVAAQMEPGAGALPLGRLRDAVRAEPAAAEQVLDEVLAALPPSPLASAARRWAAALARATGDNARAEVLLDEASAGGHAPPGVARDRVDLWVAAGAPGETAAARAILARARAAFGASPALATLALDAAAGRARAGDASGALGELGAALEQMPDAVPLGIAAAEIARGSADPEVRVAGLDLWLRADAARRPEAARALARALEARGGEGSELGVRAALQTCIEAAPGGAVFWATAARDGRAGRSGDAAAVLAYGAELWAASALARPLAERAAEWHARAAPAEARAQLDALVAADPSPALRWTAARAAARAGDAAAEAAALGAGAALEADPHGRAGAALRRALAVGPGAGDSGGAGVGGGAAGGGEAWRAGLEAALAAAPDHPVALALLLGDAATPPERITEALWAAGAQAEARRLRLYAVLWAALVPERERALALAQALHDADPSWAPARSTLLRVAETVASAEAGARARAALPLAAGVPGDDAETLGAGEALEAIGEKERAAAALALLADGAGPLAADARRARSRMGAVRSLLAEKLASDADAVAAEVVRGLGRLDEAARGGRWGEATDALADGNPYAAGLLAEGRGDGARARLLFEAAVASGVGTAATAIRAEAFEAAAARVGPEAGADVADRRSMATFLCRAAAARAARGDKEGAARCMAEAVAADPDHLPAAIEARRAAARRGDVAATVDACEHEAAVLAGQAARVETLLLGAVLAAGRGQGPSTVTSTSPSPSRAVTLLRRALEVDPANETAFERLRALLAEAGQHAALAAALSARIEVARNPFELTALRMARADLLAGPLGDRAAAKVELATILNKEPQHARALARLGDLAHEDGDYAEAGELYVRRAVAERSPRELREVLLRIGRIYTRHVPEPKRAIGAYERLRQLERDNYEALAALSDLYFEAGEVKSALAVTEKLTTLETDPARRLAALVRAGQLWERTGDLRQAGARFRRAADEAPRDASAVTELARFLERTRDLAGRRALLDHAVGLLRHDVERGKFDVATLRTLVPLLQARGKGHAAAAAAQLVAAVSAEPHDREAAATWAAPPPRGRRLTGLATPEIDERSFPPGLPPGIRHVFRLAGPLLGRGAPDLARHGVGRAERAARGQPMRDAIDAVATELGVRDVDVFAGKGALLRVEPGPPAAVIVGADIVKLGPRALRFAAARVVRLVSTHLDLVLAADPADAGGLLGGVVRQFVPDYRHPEVGDELIEREAERLSKHLPRKLKQELMPFAIESAGAFDVGALHAAVRDGANAAGLLASGDLPVSLAVVLAVSGKQPSLGVVTVAAVAAEPEALALLRFALSDDYDAMAHALE